MDGEVMLLDLKFLAEEEKSIIERVLEKDEKIKAENATRLRKLRQSIKVARSHQKQQEKDTTSLQCSICDRVFTTSTSRQPTCPTCGYRVCSRCLYRPRIPPPEFLCRICHETGFLHIQSTSEKEDGLYGSNLMRDSLRAIFKNIGPSSSTHVSIEIPVSKPLSPVSPVTPVTSEEPVEKKPDVESNIPKIIIRCDSQTSITSSTSLYSAMEAERHDYEINGEVLVGVVLREQYLFIHVNQARDLTGVNSNGLSNPYIKTYLLPDNTKKSKRRTKIKRHTINPTYDEVLKYKLKTDDHSLLVVWLSVWNSDRFGRNMFLGELNIPLSTHDLNNAIDHWMPLKNRQLDHLRPIPPSGTILIGLMYRQTQGTTGSPGDLYVLVKQARLNTPVLRDAFITCHLLPDRSKKLKTHVITSSTSPKWMEELVLTSIPLEDLRRNCVLELTIWDYNERHSSDFLGGVRLGPFAPTNNKWMDCIGEEVTHWEAMLSNHGHWVESWHELRSTMKPRDTDSEVLTQKEEISERDDVNTPDIIETESNYSDNSTQQDPFGQSETGSFIGSTISYNCTWNPPKGNYTITGEVLIAFEVLNQVLLIHVNRARNLAAADRNGLSDPYVKTYLLPEKSHKWKRKTSVKHKTLNPEYNETLKYKLPSNTEYSSLTIWLSVWDKDVIGKNRFLGEVYIPLWMFNLREDTHKQWYTLRDHVTLPRSASLHLQTLLVEKGDTDDESVLSESVVLKSERSNSATLPSYTTSSSASVTVTKKENFRDDKGRRGGIHDIEEEGEQQVDTSEENGKEKMFLEELKEAVETRKMDELSATTQDNTAKLTDSQISIESSWSYSNDININKGSYEISGKILVGLVQKGKILEVTIKEANGLAAAEETNSSSSPYVKTYLLPDLSQKSKKKTAVKKNTLNPVYNETLKYNLSRGKASSSTGLWLSVWHYDRLGKNMFLGEVHFTLSTLDLSNYQEQWYTLMNVERPPVPELEMGLSIISYPKNKNLCKLAIKFEQARNLSFNNKKGMSVYVKCYLLPDRSTYSKRKTKTVTAHFNNPAVWKEQVVYEKLEVKKLMERSLVISVCTVHRGSSNVMIGRFQIGKSASLALPADQVDYDWGGVFETPGEWITAYYRLKG